MMLNSQANADTYKVGDTFYCSSEDGAFAQASGDWRRLSRLAFLKFSTISWPFNQPRKGHL
jgi:hypothetical protein